MGSLPLKSGGISLQYKREGKRSFSAVEERSYQKRGREMPNEQRRGLRRCSFGI